MKDLEGAVDGVNKDFYVPSAFLPVESDSERIFLRGIPRVKSWDDGWIVLDYATGHFRLNEAPLVGDPPPAALFLQVVPDVALEQVTKLVGQIRVSPTPLGSIRASAKITGTVNGDRKLFPTKVEAKRIVGIVYPLERLSGKISELI